MFADLEMFALYDGDGEPRDGLVETDGEEDLGPLGRLRRLDVPLQVGVQVQLAGGQVQLLHGEQRLV